MVFFFSNCKRMCFCSEIVLCDVIFGVLSPFNNVVSHAAMSLRAFSVCVCFTVSIGFRARGWRDEGVEGALRTQQKRQCVVQHMTQMHGNQNRAFRNLCLLIEPIARWVPRLRNSEDAICNLGKATYKNKTVKFFKRNENKSMKVSHI